MTQAEEIRYLTRLLQESLRWKIDNNYDNAVELEVNRRLDELLDNMQDSAAPVQRRVRPSEAVEKPGWTLNQFRYLMRASLKDLDDDAVRAEYDKYLIRTGAPVQTSAQELSAAEKMRQEEQMWSDHFKQQYSA